MARPKKTDHEKRDQRFNLRLTVAEIEHLRAQAENAGLAPHEYARLRVTEHVVKPARQHVDAALLAELNRIGVNVNQLARAIHTDRSFQEHWQMIRRELRAVLEKVASCYDT